MDAKKGKQQITKPNESPDRDDEIIDIDDDDLDDYASPETKRNEFVK